MDAEVIKELVAAWGFGFYVGAFVGFAVGARSMYRSLTGRTLRA